MSLATTDFLFDLLRALDERYPDLYLVRAGRPSMRLMDFGPGRYEVLAQAIDLERQPELRMHTPLPCAELIRIRLKENDAGLWDVWFEGPKSDELNVSDLVGQLKEKYA